MRAFDDTRLEEPEAVEDLGLRHLAGFGARIRRASLVEPIGSLEVSRPRGVIAVGAEARLVRAVLEPVCPVPFVAWPAEGLPNWVGPLDLVVVLDSVGGDHALLASARQAVRRGAMLLVVTSAESELAVAASSRSTMVLPSEIEDATAAAVAALGELHRLGLGPLVVPEDAAEAADIVAERCSPMRELTQNPGKLMALAMADEVPLIWGGTVLAARAGRRIAEAIRLVSGRNALAVEADDLDHLLAGLNRRDPFVDPFDAPAESPYPALIVLEDSRSPSVVHHTQVNLTAQAEGLGVRVHTISAGEPESSDTDVDRYITLLQQGLYGAAYLGLGLGRPLVAQ